MSHSKSSETDLMKNLSVNEKRKLMRHIESSQQGNVKKSSSNHSASSKINNSVSSKVRLTAAVKVSSSRVTNSSQNQADVRSVPSHIVSKSRKTSHGKLTKAENPSSKEFLSKVSTVHNSAAVSPKTKDSKRPFTAPASRSSTPRPNSAVKSVVSQAPNSASKEKRKSKVGQPAISKPSSNGHNISSSKTVSSSSKTSLRKQSSPATESVSITKKENKTKQLPKKSTTHDVDSASKAEQKGLNNKPQSVKSTFSKSSKSSSVSTPTPARHPWAEPLSNKSINKSSPPTAVVTPIQDNSKRTNSGNDQTNSEDESAKVLSSSLPLKPEDEAVIHTSSSEKVNLPDLSIAEKNSVMAKDKNIKKPALDAAKVAALANDAGKNRKLGHDFRPHELKEWVNWCDACGSVILSLFGKCVSCTKCRMVCHGKCALAVSLTCEADEQTRSLTLTDDTLSFYKTVVQETKDEATLKEYNTIQRVISIEEVQERIEEFNKTVKGSQQMTLQDDGQTFRGFIRVSMNLTRPVSVLESSSKTMQKPINHQRKSSFFVDKGALKALHLTSDTTCEQVVGALLVKYGITDNPMKFALFEKQVREEGHVILRKMLPRERPLFLRLLWSNGNTEKRGFTLQENESRDIHWESFSIAELQMFIKILDKEENDYIANIRKKYKNKSQDLMNAMDYQAKLKS